MSSPAHKRKAPSQNCKAPYWKLSDDGSGWRSRSRSLWQMRSIKVCKEAIFWFAISSFKTQKIRCTRSSTVLTLSEMRSWWIAWNSEMRCVFSRLLAFWSWSELRWLSRGYWRGGLSGSEACISLFFPRPVATAVCFEHYKHIIQHAEWTNSFVEIHQNIAA